MDGDCAFWNLKKYCGFKFFAESDEDMGSKIVPHHIV